MSSAFDHRIVVMSEPAKRELATWRAQPCEIWRPGCSRGCEHEPRYAATYRYVTGRQGRVTIRVQALCEAHARGFAAAHGLELPELPARARLTIAELDVEICGDVDQGNAQALEALAVFQGALKKAFDR